MTGSALRKEAGDAGGDAAGAIGSGLSGIDTAAVPFGEKLFEDQYGLRVLQGSI